MHDPNIYHTSQNQMFVFMNIIEKQNTISTFFAIMTISQAKLYFIQHLYTL